MTLISPSSQAGSGNAGATTNITGSLRPPTAATLTIFSGSNLGAYKRAPLHKNHQSLGQSTSFHHQHRNNLPQASGDTLGGAGTTTSMSKKGGGVTLFSDKYVKNRDFSNASRPKSVEQELAR